ncbi:guanosine polyphosphate synthetase/pyrophosphohydrolase [Thiorhodovibrio frisius]|uniref:Guanosine polyphosphate synthetase/pyrophosphohydrolase n=2 Tax=Thiorhodovibrio frisius TaxID=631362 RepID=H8Z2I4_9GAMM|nr:guanosine polyphosphate synthetase/pyrophosphohydrolase [Thiorhodovibrio frisius]WPL21605.1 GTP pyrophosphokinase rsh [Thiorhodovibrio frisius]
MEPHLALNIMNTSVNESSLLLQAAAFAAEKHRHQRRKDAAASPYINHPLAVAWLLSSEGGVRDSDLLAAALLHDTVEDTDATLVELEQSFGPAISALVAEVTDDKSLPKHRRKALQIEHAAHASASAKQLKIADKIANIRDILADPPAGWPLERKLEYLDWAEQVARCCRGINRALDARWDATIAEARRALKTED